MARDLPPLRTQAPSGPSGRCVQLAGGELGNHVLSHLSPPGPSLATRLNELNHRVVLKPPVGVQLGSELNNRQLSHLSKRELKNCEKNIRFKGSFKERATIFPGRGSETMAFQALRREM
ncbi:hypothetical protein Naga_101575g1 [Nannochloropsis gaditana]|uniref:Uncharacterized protein n=1 Tax=Nannochloropsis gaditana TaxID=72520 RepID=W7TSI4_9STRA|nr:hypothetical protein Naga_101575g1 [Nannochloropsis gaditana]